ncbi:hypothetical protein NP493_2g07027 [Ridgeia piscesae]|uniref:Phospholipase B1, membrane-associated n=1 Tax=Ridgeia piscesae TaxID=27915 RepID=A0AAD9ULP3_RIDPI|nr:hypothetical protein NP493_2g07027 [Ridgeia piscesae]
MDVMGMMRGNRTLQGELNRKLRNSALNSGALPVIDFNCEVTNSSAVPTSVHKLRPSDIKVVAAMGDSMTAGHGIGAKNPLEIALMNRGESFSIGGDKSLEGGVLTLANILRKFNPALKGFSVGKSFSWQDEAGFNVAEPGHKANHMLDDAKTLVDYLKSSHEWGYINFAEDWKITTLFIGGNDLCAYCKNREGRSAEKYAENIMKALDVLQKDVPRMLVQVVVMFDVSPLRFLQDGFLCELLQDKFCHCALDGATRGELRPVQLQYYEALKQLIEVSGRYDQKEDFTVVLQPFMRDWLPPKDKYGDFDRSYFSLDCFHPGRKLHQSMAYSLWNNMLIPVGQKPLVYDHVNNRRYSCPIEVWPCVLSHHSFALAHNYILC